MNYHPSLIHFYLPIHFPSLIPGFLSRLKDSAAGEGNWKCIVAHIKCSSKTEWQRGHVKIWRVNCQRVGWVSLKHETLVPQLRQPWLLFTLQMHCQYWSWILLAMRSFLKICFENRKHNDNRKLPLHTEAKVDYQSTTVCSVDQFSAT